MATTRDSGWCSRLGPESPVGAWRICKSYFSEPNKLTSWDRNPKARPRERLENYSPSSWNRELFIQCRRCERLSLFYARQRKTLEKTYYCCQRIIFTLDCMPKAYKVMRFDMVKQHWTTVKCDETQIWTNQVVLWIYKERPVSNAFNVTW